MAFSSNAPALRSASRVVRLQSFPSKLPAAASVITYPLMLADATFAGVVGSLWSSQQTAFDLVEVSEALPAPDSALPHFAEGPSTAVPRLELDLGNPFTAESDAPLLASDLPAPSPSLPPSSSCSREAGRAARTPLRPLVFPPKPRGRLPLSGRRGPDFARVTLTPLSSTTARAITAGPTVVGVRALGETAEKQIAKFDDLQGSLRNQDSVDEAHRKIIDLEKKFELRELRHARQLEAIEQQRRRDADAHVARERDLEEKLAALIAERDQLAKDSQAALDAAAAREYQAAAEAASYRRAYEEIHELATLEVTLLREQIAAQAQERDMILLKAKELQDERDQLFLMLRDSEALRVSEKPQALVAAPVDVRLAPQAEPADEMDCDDFEFSPLPPSSVTSNNHNAFQVPCSATAAVAPFVPAFVAAPALAAAPAFAAAPVCASAASSFLLAPPAAPPSPPALPVYRSAPSPTAPRYPTMVSKGWIEGKKALQKASKKAKEDAQQWLEEEREKQQTRDSKFHTAKPEPKQLPATAKRRAREDDRDDLATKRVERFYAAMMDRFTPAEADEEA